MLGAVAEPLRHEWGLSDAELGLLATAFTLLYAVVGVPLGRLADVGSRSRLLSVGVAVWSGLTYASGLCRSYGALFAARLGVGVGEASCAPAATSLLGDLFPPRERGRAMAVFMLGLPVGVALSYAVSGHVAERYGWRSAFFVAGAPGLVLALACAFLPEPVRGSREERDVAALEGRGSPYVRVLAIPAMGWIIVSGALHNFNMYAISSFLPALLVRYHHTSLRTAGVVSGILVGVLGGVGMLVGGWAGDALARRRRGGRMLVAGVALLASVPASVAALAQPEGAVASFTAFQGAACLLMYVYYATVYATIQDVVEPGLRGTAMALYFLAMYVLGASLGPVGTGWISDILSRRAAEAAGAALSPGGPVPEAFRAIGLHQALGVVPVLGILLGLVLLAGWRVVRDDVGRLDGGDGSSPAARRSA